MWGGIVSRVVWCQILTAKAWIWDAHTGTEDFMLHVSIIIPLMPCSHLSPLLWYAVSPTTQQISWPQSSAGTSLLTWQFPGLWAKTLFNQLLTVVYVYADIYNRGDFYHNDILAYLWSQLIVVNDLRNFQPRTTRGEKSWHMISIHKPYFSYSSLKADYRK